MAVTKTTSQIKPETKAKWLRGLYMVVLFICGWIAADLAVVIGIFQFIWTLITNDSNKYLLQFSKSLTQYIYQIVRFLTYVSEEKAFPFNTWPTAESHKTTAKK